MLTRIKAQIEKELQTFIAEMDRSYGLRRLSPLLYERIRDFFLRDGKRVRPMLFVMGFRGFAAKDAPHLFASALAIELLHDFMLVHDDIIDRSDTRRGKPSMHAMLNADLRGQRRVKFTGEDLAIVVGDVMYAMAIRAFLSVEVPWPRKEAALRRFIEAAIYTGSGEFIELIYGAGRIEETSLEHINRVYDYKTAFYTFACPLTTGALLAGAPEGEISRVDEFGMCLGRAFQIKDDILGMFGEESAIGKSSLTDMREAKKTLLVWHAWRNGAPRDRAAMQRIFLKRNAGRAELTAMRRIITSAGSLDYAAAEVRSLQQKAKAALQHSRMKRRYRAFLLSYADSILTL